MPQAAAGARLLGGQRIPDGQRGDHRLLEIEWTAMPAAAPIGERTKAASSRCCHQRLDQFDGAAFLQAERDERMDFAVFADRRGTNG